jgi:glycosyltransferase involved in cell wall biosynthesis
MPSLKLLLIHNYYRLTGGEDSVFQQECALLRENNLVETLTFYNSNGIFGLFQFVFSIWNVSAAKRMRRKVFEFKPDVIHLHNWHFASGPIIIRTASRLGIPIVLTVHNHRILCPSGTLLVNEKIFTSSIGRKFPWEAVKLRVYRNSLLQTFWLAFIVWFHKKIGTWELVDKYIILTHFTKGLFLSSNLKIPEDRFYVKPNFALEYPLGEVRRDEAFLFIGRLSIEKGILVLLEAFKTSDAELYIAGEGPLLDAVLSAVQINSRIHYLGRIDKAEVNRLMRKCSALLFPSICYETFGLVIIEAFALGLPVIGSDIGSSLELITNSYNGLHFEAGNAISLCNALKGWRNLSVLDHVGFRINAYNTYKEHYTPERNKKQLMNLYQMVLK